jgi:hypothetical protein
LSTHAIGPIRLLLGSLILLILGGGAFWWFFERLAGEAVLVIRDGSLEIEPWVGQLQSEGFDLVWNYQPTDVEIGVYRSTDDENELELGEPLKYGGVRGVRIDLRLGGTTTVADAVVMSTTDEALRISVKRGQQLVRRGDVWVHQGFLQDGRKQRFQIAKIELLDRTGSVIARYQNPDQGRRVKFRIKLIAAGGGHSGR